MWKIKGKYLGQMEDIDCFDTKAEAEKMLTEYRLAFSPGWSLKIVRGSK